MRRKPRNDAELEQQADICRIEPARHSQEFGLELKILGCSWGRPRKKMEG